MLAMNNNYYNTMYMKQKYGRLQKVNVCDCDYEFITITNGTVTHNYK